MRKIFQIALVLALAGAALVGCTKDYSGDISDLNKNVSEIQSVVSVMKTDIASAAELAQTALDDARKALADAEANSEKLAAQAELISGNTEDIAAQAGLIDSNAKAIAANAELIASLKTRIEALEAKVAELAGLEAKVNEIAEQLRKDVNADVQKAVEQLKGETDAALKGMREELGEAVEKLGSIFDVREIGNCTAYYFVNEWNPGTGKAQKELFGRLAERFPALAEIKAGEVIKNFGNIPFFVNPTDLVLDDTYKFSLVDIYGEDTGIKVGNPQKGFALKSNANVWNVEIQGPAKDEDGEDFYGYLSQLSLLVENAKGQSSQTAAVFGVYAYEDIEDQPISVRGNDARFVFDGESSFDVFKSYNGNSPMFDFSESACPLFGDYFMLEIVDKADIEEFGITIDGSKLSFTKAPVGSYTRIDIRITAAGINGSVVEKTAELRLTGSIAPNVKLADKSAVLGYNPDASGNPYSVAVIYSVSEFGFTDLQWKDCFASLRNDGDVYIFDSKGEEVDITSGLKFYDADGKSIRPSADQYAKVKGFGFSVHSNEAVPGKYNVEITDSKTFYGKGSLTIKNPDFSEDPAIKLREAICDGDGVLQIIGSISGGKIVYDFTEAILLTPGVADFVRIDDVIRFRDNDARYDEDSWLNSDYRFSIPVASANDNRLYQPREFAVDYYLFGNRENKFTFTFKAQAVSSVYSKTAANFTVGECKTKFNLAGNGINLAKKLALTYTAGQDRGKAATLFSGTPSVLTNEDIASIRFAFVNPTEAAKYAELSADSYSFIVKDVVLEDIPSGSVVIPMTVTLIDKWGLKMAKNFNVTVTTK